MTQGPASSIEDSAPAQPVRPGTGSPSFLMLVRIANFAALRRRAGCAEAASFGIVLARGIGDALPGALVHVAGRDLLEVRGETRDAESLGRMIDAIESVAAGSENEIHRFELSVGAVIAAASDSDDVRLFEAAEHALAELGPGASRALRQLGDEAGEAERDEDRASLARDLVRAIAEGDEMVLHYQPKLHVRHQRIGSLEALIRWQHPTRGMVLPNDFIPMAEASAGIVDLTLWTMRQVIADQARLLAVGYDLPIFINIAGVLLGDTRFVEAASTLVEESGARIGFEITETSVIRDPDGAIANLNRFARLGITVAIDDYGAGLSSLAYLKQLPARELKIDKLFVTQLTSSHRDPLIVRSTIDLAHAMEMEVVAEGVETQAALALLAVMGCDMVQGYFISRPLPFDALVAFLKEDAQHVTRPDPRGLLAGRGAAWRVA